MLKLARREEFDQLAGQLNQMLNQLSRQFGDFCPVESWTPPVNVYRLERGLEVCVDLAGVAPGSLEVAVEPGRLVLRGFRASPEPPSHGDERMQILSMEIDHGPFNRTLRLPEHLDLPHAQTEYKDGLLWIHLPARKPG